MKALADLHRARLAARARAPEIADRAVYYLGLDVPVELIRAAGFIPIALAASEDAGAAAPYAEGAGHPYLRAIVSALAIAGRGVRRLIVSSTPSFYCGLAAFLREAQRAGAGFEALDLYLFDLNRGESRRAAPLRRNALERLQRRLEAWADGAIAEASLWEAIALQNEIRLLQRQVQALRVRAPARLSGAQALAILSAGEDLEGAPYRAHLEALLAEAPNYPIQAGARVLYSGTLCDGGVYEEIEAGGRLIVADDQDRGARAIGPLVADLPDPLEALAQRYFARDPAPARWDTHVRTHYLLDLARESDAEAVLFNIAPWDHPPAWDFPAQKRALEAAGIGCEMMEAAHV
jgi:benzoyl-CoA reductase/2-hydroxyglutaryl-CoA dehydratase subunit BcrC/BadD/HgdB